MVVLVLRETPDVFFCVMGRSVPRSVPKPRQSFINRFAFFKLLKWTGGFPVRHCARFHMSFPLSVRVSPVDM